MQNQTKSENVDTCSRPLTPTFHILYFCLLFVHSIKGKKKTVKIGWATWTHASNDGCTVSHRINSAQLSVVAWHKLLYDSLSLSLKSSLRSPSKHCRLFTDNKKKKTKKRTQGRREFGAFV